MRSNYGTSNREDSQEGGGRDMFLWWLQRPNLCNQANIFTHSREAFIDWSILSDSVEGRKDIQSVHLHIVLPVSSAPSFSSSDRNKMPGRKISGCLFWVLHCYGRTAASVLLWVFSPDISKTSSFQSCVGSCVCVCDSRLISTWHPRYFCAFYYRRAFPLLAGKQSRYLESLLVIGSGQERRHGWWVVVGGRGGWHGCRRDQRDPPAKVEQRNVCVCV